jgi:hypothetical protein
VEHAAHCIFVRIELVFERNTACQSGFSRGTSSHFVPNMPIQLRWKNTCISRKTKPSTLQSGASSTCFTLRIEFVFERNTACHQGIPGLETCILFQIKLFIWVVEAHGSLKRKPLCENQAHLPCCFPVNAELAYERNRACLSGFSRGRNTHFLPNRPITVNCWNTCISR